MARRKKIKSLAAEVGQAQEILRRRTGKEYLDIPRIRSIARKWDIKESKPSTYSKLKEAASKVDTGDHPSRISHKEISPDTTFHPHSLLYHEDVVRRYFEDASRRKKVMGPPTGDIRYLLQETNR